MPKKFIIICYFFNATSDLLSPWNSGGVDNWTEGRAGGVHPWVLEMSDHGSVPAHAVTCDGLLHGVHGEQALQYIKLFYTAQMIVKVELTNLTEISSGSSLVM